MTDEAKSEIEAGAESTDVNSVEEAAEAVSSAADSTEGVTETTETETTEVEAAEPAADETADSSEAEQPKAEKSKRRKAKDETPAKPEPAAKKARRAPAEVVVVHARAKFVRTSARKARLVCDNIRGKSVDDARAILAHTPRAAAVSWSKLLESAVANAEHNHDLDGRSLRIVSIQADEGPTLKRFRPRAQGRATPIHKRTAHLSIALSEKEQ